MRVRVCVCVFVRAPECGCVGVCERLCATWLACVCSSVPDQCAESHLRLPPLLSKRFFVPMCVPQAPNMGRALDRYNDGNNQVTLPPSPAPTRFPSPDIQSAHSRRRRVPGVRPFCVK